MIMSNTPIKNFRKCRKCGLKYKNIQSKRPRTDDQQSAYKSEYYQIDKQWFNIIIRTTSITERRLMIESKQEGHKVRYY